MFKVKGHDVSVSMTENNYQQFLLCGNSMRPWCIKPDGDTTWNHSDWVRAQTLEIRFHRLGVNEAERRILVPAAVWRMKWPGMVFSDTIMNRLRELCYS
jgi:hypothetical protein